MRKLSILENYIRKEVANALSEEDSKSKSDDDANELSRSKKKHTIIVTNTLTGEKHHVADFSGIGDLYICLRALNNAKNTKHLEYSILKKKTKYKYK